MARLLASHELASPIPSIERSEWDSSLVMRTTFETATSPSATLSSNDRFWGCVTEDFKRLYNLGSLGVKSMVQRKLLKYRTADHTIRPVDPDGYRIESLLWRMAYHITGVRQLDNLRHGHQEGPLEPVPEVDMSVEEIEEDILKRSKLAEMRYDFDQARELLFNLSDMYKAEQCLDELESRSKLHDQKEKHHEMESAKAESDGDWEKAKSTLLLMENKLRSGRLIMALEKRQAIQEKYNKRLQEEIVEAQFVDRDLTKACSLVSQMKGKRPKAFVALFKCNEALAQGDFTRARSILSNPQLPSAHIALGLMVDLAEEVHNDNQEKAASLSLLLKRDCGRFQKVLLDSQAGVSAESCDGHVEAPSLLYDQPKDASGHLSDLAEKQSEQAALAGDWNKAKKSLLGIPKNTVSGPLLRKLEEERSAFYEMEKDLERQAKEAERNGDWEKARSFLSRIQSDFGKFLLAALAYSEARLSLKEEHMELFVELQKEYPDPRLEQVKFTQYFEYTERNGPQERSIDLHSLFVGEKMFGTGVLWKKPADFRKVFEMMAEDMRDACDRAWYGLPALNVQSLAAYRRQPREVHIAGQPPSSEIMQAGLGDSLGTSSSSPTLPAIPRDPCMVIPGPIVVREYQWDRPELPSLSFDQQLILIQICLRHKKHYTKPQGNIHFWHRVADQFWGVAGWHWKRIRTYIQAKVRSVAASDRGPRILPLLGEFRSHIHSLKYPSPRNIVMQSRSPPRTGSRISALSPRPIPRPRRSSIPSITVFPGPSGNLTSQGAAKHGATKRTLSQTGFDVEISSDEDRPTPLASRPRHIDPFSSSLHAHSESMCRESSVQDLITKSNEAKERHDFDKAKSLLLQISDKTVLEPLLAELDKARESQIQINRDLERRAKEAELKDERQTAKSLLSRVVGEDPSFLLLALEYSRTRKEWEIFESEEALEQLKKKYPDPRLEQVELDQISSVQKCLATHERSVIIKGSFVPTKGKMTCAVLVTMFGMQHHLELGLQDLNQTQAPHLNPILETSLRKWICLPHPDCQKGRGRSQAQSQPQSQPQSQDLDLDQELDFLDRARAEIISGNDKAKALLRQGSSEECKEALLALNRSQQMLLGDFEESATSLMAQTEDAENEW
ncbi:uncharacterized protein PGRI_029280 [Penicillium griseofulvum]|uniref:Uncharacterized protein n=1 Tax=Penicillium patulum TaxID=5078 RepID=A0A135LJF1_PENPA|nr:uncharacterized protein PGRI_029280 [Penicillium griseofulvum]KXG49058.1 hypothetical protein PGRI_029280 [Penicillium griseofulvum]